MIYTKTIYIEYKDSDGNALSDTVESTSGTAYTNYNLTSTIAGTAPKLSNKIPTKSGYNFLGWDKEKNQITDPDYTKEQSENQTEIIEVEENLTLYAVWEKQATKDKPLSDFNAEGIVTNYTPTDSNTGITKWYPFAYDGTNYYIIAGDYYTGSLPDTLSYSTGTYKNGVYTTSSDTGTCTKGSKSEFWKRYEFNDETNQQSTRLCNILLTTSNWTNVKDNTYAKEAIGSPTLEMVAKAYNGRKGSEIITYSKDGNYGLTSSGSINTSDKAFNIGNISNICYGYKLASPYCNNRDRVWDLDYRGYIGDGVATTYSSTGDGLRPVIKIYSNYKIIPDGTNYKIQ